MGRLKKRFDEITAEIKALDTDALFEENRIDESSAEILAWRGVIRLLIADGLIGDTGDKNEKTGCTIYRKF